MVAKALLALILGGGLGLAGCGAAPDARNGEPAMEGKKKFVYVASPLGFSELGRLAYGELLRVIEKAGLGIIDPWTLTEQKKIDAVLALPYGPAKRDAWAELNKEIGANNARGIERADAIVAVLDGPDVDSGTAAEIGYGAALKKPVIGYRGDFRLAADNEGSVVNLQVEYFIRLHGGKIARDLKELDEALRMLAK